VGATLHALVPRHPVVGLGEQRGALELLAVVEALAGLHGFHLINLGSLVHLLRMMERDRATWMSAGSRVYKLGNPNVAA
jgi:hypothetical protein